MKKSINNNSTENHSSLIEKISHLLLIECEDEKLLLTIWIISLFIKNIEKPLLVIKAPTCISEILQRDLIKKIINAMRPKNVCMKLRKFKKSYLKKQIKLGTSSVIAKYLSMLLTALSSDERRIQSSLKRGKIIFEDDKLLSSSFAFERTLFIRLQTNIVEGSLSRKRLLKEYEKLFSDIREKIKEIVYKSLFGSSNNIFSSKTAETISFIDWGVAFAEGLGFGRENFIRAYEKNIKSYRNGGLINEIK
jgi:hypothetical protein